METGFDQIAQALGNRARRRLLVELLDHNPVDTPGAVANHVVGEPEERDVELVHMHLPKLDDLGYIVWDRDHQNVLKGPNWEEIEPVLRLLEDNSERVPRDTF